MKNLKNATLVALAALCLSASLSSCATIFGGPITDYQKRKPIPGEQRRPIRIGALIADIVLFPIISIPGDFITGAIYKPPVKPITAAPVGTNVVK